MKRQADMMWNETEEERTKKMLFEEQFIATNDSGVNLRQQSLGQGTVPAPANMDADELENVKSGMEVDTMPQEEVQVCGAMPKMDTMSDDEMPERRIRQRTSSQSAMDPFRTNFIEFEGTCKCTMCGVTDLNVQQTLEHSITCDITNLFSRPVSLPDEVVLGALDKELVQALTAGHCNICDVKMTGVVQASQHLEGKRHRRNILTAKLHQFTMIGEKPPQEPTYTYTAADKEVLQMATLGRCNLCNAKINHMSMARTHFLAKRHQAKLNKPVLFLENRPANLISPPKEAFKAGSKVFFRPKMRHYLAAGGCWVCQVPLENDKEVSDHQQTREHAKAIHTMRMDKIVEQELQSVSSQKKKLKDDKNLAVSGAKRLNHGLLESSHTRTKDTNPLTLPLNTCFPIDSNDKKETTADNQETGGEVKEGEEEEAGGVKEGEEEEEGDGVKEEEEEGGIKKKKRRRRRMRRKIRKSASDRNSAADSTIAVSECASTEDISEIHVQNAFIAPEVADRKSTIPSSTEATGAAI